MADRFGRNDQSCLAGLPLVNRYSPRTYPPKYALFAQFEGAHRGMLPVRLGFRCKFHKSRHQIYKKVRSYRLRSPPPSAHRRHCRPNDSSTISNCAACSRKTCLGHHSHVQSFVFGRLERRSPCATTGNCSIFRAVVTGRSHTAPLGAPLCSHSPQWRPVNLKTHSFFAFSRDCGCESVL